nr:MAG TPA: hypothetical protein [Bacteriophage sp.]
MLAIIHLQLNNFYLINFITLIEKEQYKNCS